MLFNSIEFAVFFLAVYAAYLVLPFRAQNILLLVASYVFYGSWDWRFLSLIWFSSTLDFFVAQGLHASRDLRQRRIYLAISVCINLGILFLFKYYGFFSHSLQALFASLGISVSWTTLNIVLPVGVSFYTFQTMSYVVDVYRGDLPPARRYLDYLLFVSYFPQLVAGPIERARNLLGQLSVPRTVTWTHVREGAWFLLLGYYKKTVIADNLAPFANEIFNAPEHAQGLAIVAGLLAFCFQIYGDFSGYSDIARGLARLMGVDLMANFRMPYFAVSPSDFWSRWHISLSTWLRDYLYIPLGGNRHGVANTYRNLMLTMLLGGLWHGAAWHFVAWGAYHGVLLVIYRLAETRFTPPDRCHGFKRALALALFFLLTCGGWLLFRVNQFGDLSLLAKGLWAGWRLNGLLCLFTIACTVTPLLLIEIGQERRQSLLAIKTWPRAVRLLVYLALWAGILLAGAVETQEFIYFQF